jgi:hypothetical protein
VRQKCNRYGKPQSRPVEMFMKNVNFYNEKLHNSNEIQNDQQNSMMIHQFKQNTSGNLPTSIKTMRIFRYSKT